MKTWLLALGSLTLLLGALLGAVNLLPEPWPRVLSALLLVGLLTMLGLMAMASFVGTPLGLASRGERGLIAWTARFAPDPGAFLLQLAETAPTLDRARQRLALAAERGCVPAMRELGRDYLEGAMGTAGRAAGLPWLRRAADLGDPESAYWLAEAFRWGVATSGRSEEAHQFYVKAARGGYRPAAIWLARVYATGDGLAADQAQAAAWAQRAEALAGGEAPGSSLLQRLMERPSTLESMAEDLREAGGQLEGLLWPRRWFRSLIWASTILFLGLLGVFVLVTPFLVGLVLLIVIWLFVASFVLRLYGLGLRRTSRTSGRLEARAKAGDPAACYELGRRYEEGDADLPRDRGAARNWFRRAVQAGHPEALLRLADLLSWGLGGPKDVAEARRLLQRAVAQGLPAAHARLGRLETGLSAEPPRSDEKIPEGAP